MTNDCPCGCKHRTNLRKVETCESCVHVFKTWVSEDDRYLFCFLNDFDDILVAEDEVCDFYKKATEEDNV